MKRIAALVFLLCTVTFYANAQKGKQGSKTISGTEVINEFTDLTADASAGDVLLNVTNSSLNGNGRFSNVLSEGDLILIIQIQGVSIETSDRKDFGWGEITNYNNCGNYEYAEVESVPNGSSIELSCPLSKDYTASGKVQIIRVPRYTSLNIPVGTTLTSDAWDGTVGGLLVVEVENNCTIEGIVDMSALGFRGTASGTNTGSANGASNEYASSNQAVAGLKGEGVVGYHAEYDGLQGRFGRGAAANAGGGGLSTDGGGGGGANVGNTAIYTGYGVASLTDPDWAQAWELELIGLSTAVSSGGGRGGYSRCSDVVNPLTNAPNSYVLWGSDGRRPQSCGLGGRPLDYSTGRLFLGGGGGQAHGNERGASAGGSGGGLVIIEVGGDLLGSGSVLSNGEDGESNQNANGFISAIDGGGGAGAGGTVILNTEGSLSGIVVEAVGGQGGTVTQTSFANPEENNGPGGGGGGGYVRISSTGPSVDVSGGANGEMISSTMSLFRPNGATIGGIGQIDTVAFSAPSLIVTHDTICPGETATVSATGNNLPGGAVITWYDSYSDGTVLGTGNTYLDAGITTDTMFFVGICPGTFKDTVFVKMGSPVTADVVNDTVNTCAGVDVQIEALGGTQYAWYPNVSISDSALSNPTVNLSSSATFYVAVSSSGGCSDTDSVFVNVSSSLVVDLGSSQTICTGDSVTLTASGGTIYTWTPNLNISSTTDAVVKVAPTDTTQYFVTVDDGSGCTGTDSVMINVLPAITVVSPGNQEVCIDQVVPLILSHSGGSGGSVTYSWDEGAFTGANQSFSWNADASMEVKVTDDLYGCSDSITIIINVRTFDLDFTYSDTCFQSLTQFTAVTSASGTITDYDWNFYNAFTGTGVNSSFQFPSVGSNTVKLYVTDDINCVDSVEKSFSIMALPNTTIVFAPDTVCVNHEVIYTNNYAGVSNTSFEWDFGDGSSDNNENGTYSYTSAGLFYISLNVTDNNGCSFEAVDSIVVQNGPQASFTMPAEGKIGETVSLSNTTVDGQIYTWTRDGVFLSSDQDIELLLDSTGAICIELMAQSQAGCLDSTSNCIEVLGEELVIPNIFTPNGDGENDVFALMNFQNKVVEIKVLNRWGTEVYTNSTYLNDWDGRDSNGNDVAEGTYFYIITDKTGDIPFSQNGFLQIMR